MRPVNADPSNVQAAVKALLDASHENDPTEIAQNVTFDTTFTNTFQLLVGTPTLANTNAVLATLLAMLQRGGLNRTT